MARPTPLADPAFAKLVAQAFVDGMSRAEMCAEFGVRDPDTITRWRRDARVKGYALKLIEDRVYQVTRKVDGKIAAKLDEDLTVTELVMIRKEFLGGALRTQTERADDETVNEAQSWLEENPEQAEKLQEMLRSGDLPGVGSDD